MSMQVVNGYVCQSCSDVSLAKKGVNPAHPKDDPANPGYDAKTAKADKAKDTGGVAPAVVFGGALAGLNKTSTAQDASSAAAVSLAPDPAKSVTTPPSSTQSAPAYSSATSSPPQNGSPYSPGTLLNVSA